MADPQDETEDEVTSALITELPTSKDYYILEVYHADWYYILSRFIRDHKAPNIRDGFMMNMPPAPPTYYFAKSFYTPEVIGKLLGIDPDVALAAKTLRLKEPGDQSKWETPNVPYIGEA